VDEREPTVKGLSLQHWLQSFARIYGPERTEALRARLSSECSAALREGFDGKAWYPVAWYREMCAAAQQVTGEGLLAIARVARMSATSEFSGVHRVLLLFVSPQRLLSIAARVFGRYYSEGSVEAASRGSNSAQVRWIGCTGFDESLWHDTFHASTVAIELCGGKNVSFDLISGGRDGEDQATVVFSWR
jgi:hypothetical protein